MASRVSTMRLHRTAEDLTGAFAVAFFATAGLMASSSGLLFMAIWTSASVGGARRLFSFQVGSNTITLSGCLTFLLFFGTVIFLGRHSKVCWKLLYKNYRFFLLFSGFLAVRVLDAPDKWVAVKELALMTTPLAIGLVGEIALLRGLRAGWIETQLLLAPCVVVAMLVYQSLVGAVAYDDYGLLSTIGKGPIALFALPIFALALSHWRYTTGRQWPRWAIVLSLGLILLTVERMASAVAVLVLLPARYVKFNAQFARNAAVTIVAGCAAALLLFQVPIVKNRFLESKENPTFSQQDEIINTSGRAETWYLTAMHAAERPIWGHGTGAAEVFLAETNSILDHPHNEYLRVYHDLGVVGLTLFLAAWFGRLLTHFRRWRAFEATPDVAQPQMAATLAALAFVFLFLTDNVLVATFVQIPAFLLFAIADGSLRAAISKGRLRAMDPVGRQPFSHVNAT